MGLLKNIFVNQVFLLIDDKYYLLEFILNNILNIALM